MKKERVKREMKRMKATEENILQKKIEHYKHQKLYIQQIKLISFNSIFQFLLQYQCLCVTLKININKYIIDYERKKRKTTRT